MTWDKRKGFWAGWKKAGPLLKFTIIIGVLSFASGIVYFVIPIYFNPTVSILEEARTDRKIKHEEIRESHADQTGILNRIEKGVNELRKNRPIVQSSAVTVRLNFHVSEKTPRSFNGTIANTTETCVIETKSGIKLNYISSPGSTRMIRAQETYEFLYKAELPPDVSKIRSAPEEFLGAKRISIPVRGFIEIMRKYMSSKGICTIEQIEIGYYVNGTLITKQIEEVGEKVIEGKADMINFTIRASKVPLDQIRGREK